MELQTEDGGVYPVHTGNYAMCGVKMEVGKEYLIEGMRGGEA